MGNPAVAGTEVVMATPYEVVVEELAVMGAVMGVD